jgi:L-ascorbate metabolism protein UlaG (beta-lactamase superfamily)
MASATNVKGLRLTLIGGPTVLIEWHGLRLLTDPTFDPAGGKYPSGLVTMTKTAGPALTSDAVGPLDAVLLSHDHHADNLDTTGRELLVKAGRILTTPKGARRLGGNAAGLGTWQSVDLPAVDGRTVRVTSTPAHHGPPVLWWFAGPVTGFVLTPSDDPNQALYVSGDTVWFRGLAEVARRFQVRTAILNLGAARFKTLGDFTQTMTARDALTAAGVFPDATIVPAHFQGWAHFSEGRAEVDRAFAEAGLTSRLRWLPPGEPTELV